jgi:tRNA nucleotidyltransferase/poly(A) polymerase
LHPHSSKGGGKVTSQQWPKTATEADLPSMECPPHVVQWIENLPNDVFEIVSKVSDHDGGIWIVGGAVRDVCLGLEVHDIDFAVTLEPEKMMEIFPNSIDTGIEYGTVTLRGENTFYEATTLRIESEYSDGRRPESVRWGTSLCEDLERRDFTINAMAIDVARKVMHDPHFGLQDIDRGIIRSVGQAYARISEDALRILRAYRFLDRDKAGVWKFDIELGEALRQNASKLEVVTKERIWMEFHKIMDGGNVAQVVEKMAHDGVLDMILPGQWASQHLRLESLYHPYVTQFDGLTRLALILSETFSIEVENALIVLKLSKKQRLYIQNLHARFGALPEPKTSNLRVFRSVLQDQAVQHLKLEIIVRTHDLSPSVGMQDGDAEYVESLLDMLQQLPALKAGDEPLINGHWLMQRTYLKKGIALGKLKSWLHRLQVERDLENTDDIEEVLCSLHWNEENYQDWPSLQFPE